MPSVARRFSKQVHKLPEVDKSLPLPYAKVGIEIEVEGCTMRDNARDTEFPMWDSHPDDSLRNSGMEFTTEGGMVGSQIREAIESFCVSAKKAGFSEGYPRAGIHLHLDVTDMNENSDTELLNMVQAYMLFEHVFFAFAGEWRRACGFCDSLLTSQADYPSISQMLYSWNTFDTMHLNEERFSKYQGLNFLPLQRQGTLEFRHLPTTFDSQRIMDWVCLCLCLQRYGKQIDDDPVTTLLKHGPEILTKIVFKGHEKLVKKYLDEKLLMEAVPEVMSLRLMRRKGKLDPWADPDNPLLASKKVAPKKESKKVSAAVQAAMDASIVATTSFGRNVARTFTLQEMRAQETLRTARLRAPDLFARIERAPEPDDNF